MPLSRPALTLTLATACLAAGPACAGDGAPSPTGMDAAQNLTMVVVRDVNPRIAYRGLPDTTDNPARVTATVFPGQVFGNALGGIMDTLVGDSALGDTAPTSLDLRTAREPRMVGGEAIELRAGMPVGAGATPLGMSGTIGSTVLSATSGIADTVTNAAMRATKIGVGP
ncbi:hypothetical protein [Cognatilysobacter terrigena]|uniref:hypothetical protein n=1 Tax=Cognatilysobacter terrigena TaxID=2488749 RepID=UPI00105DE738|nr:hypothetical protein [Lysobacter terrigena]